METLLLCQLFLNKYYHLITKTAIVGMFHHSHHLNSVVALPEDNDKNNLHPFCQGAQYFQVLRLNPTNLPGYVIVCSYFHYWLIDRVQLKHENTVERLILTC